VSQNYSIQLRYDYDRRSNKGDYLEIICFLASRSIGFDLCPVSNSPTELIIGNERFLYEEFKRDRLRIEQLVENERESQLNRSRRY